MLRNPIVLIVEPDPLVRQEFIRIAEQFASRLSCNIVVDAKEASEKIAQETADIILLSTAEPMALPRLAEILPEIVEGSVLPPVTSANEEAGAIFELLQVARQLPDPPDIVLLTRNPGHLQFSRVFRDAGFYDVLLQEQMRSNLAGMLWQIFVEKCARRYSENKIRVKEISVLFADIQGFTRELAEFFASEDVAQIVTEKREKHLQMGYFLDRCLTAMNDIAYLNDGVIERYLGDAVMVVFDDIGPKRGDNSSNHAIRAIKTALEMRQSLKEMDTVVNIGINSGEVLEGLFGSSLYHEYTIAGNVVNIASRLQERAHNGAILIGEKTYQLAQDCFDISPEPQPAPEEEPKDEQYLCHVVYGSNAQTE